MSITHTLNLLPSFVRMDSHIVSSDSFSNVRDQQLARLNSNILLARGVRRPLMALNFCDDQLNGAPVPAYGFGPPDVLGDIIGQWLIDIGPWTQYITINLRAAEVSAAGSDAFIYPVISSPRYPATLQNSSATTITGTNETLYTMSAPVPNANRHGGLVTLSLFLHGADSGSDTKGATTIVDAGADWVLGAFGADYTDHMVYFPTDTEIMPRMINRYDANVSGTDDRVWVDRPFNKIPIPGTDTFAVRAVTGVNLYSMTVYEASVSDWNTYVGV